MFESCPGPLARPQSSAELHSSVMLLRRPDVVLCSSRAHAAHMEACFGHHSGNDARQAGNGNTRSASADACTSAAHQCTLCLPISHAAMCAYIMYMQLPFLCMPVTRHADKCLSQLQAHPHIQCSSLATQCASHVSEYLTRTSPDRCGSKGSD